MVTVGNQGQDDRYIRLWRCNMSHPAVSRSCDCHVFGQAFLSWQITERSESDWIDLRTANNPSGKKRHCIFHFQYYLQLFFTGVVNATRVARTHIKKFKRRISNSLDHDRIILLSIEVFNPFVDRHCF